jgi:UPF0271 protein
MNNRRGRRKERVFLMKIDLNCDMGENIGNDEDLMPYITSANIACGFHAGDEMSMRRTVRLAKRHGVAVGAHPGWKDREAFGRLELSLSSDEVEALMLYQLGALYAIANAESVELHHVKPHGALYNQAVQDPVLAGTIARAVKRFSPNLFLVGLAGSELVKAGIEAGLRIAGEGFPDRNYNLDGTLVSRQQGNAIIESPEEVSAHAIELVQKGVDFGREHVIVETLCIHGDHPYAAQNAKLVREALEKAGMEVIAF